MQRRLGPLHRRDGQRLGLFVPRSMPYRQFRLRDRAFCFLHISVRLLPHQSDTNRLASESGVEVFQKTNNVEGGLAHHVDQLAAEWV